ncbi:hypothetical protein PAMC26510_25845 [Caballeronia sordidicola]|uniref:Uncharacterized protein n=1 Tax=Caballeronia sordidicola TaxID=196367 RepID=A0A242MG62_CABSO|nr:hypothetical protein PAMC26510_25845 [Caballeronia sordidicola]
MPAYRSILVSFDLWTPVHSDAVFHLDEDLCALPVVKDLNVIRDSLGGLVANLRR